AAIPHPQPLEGVDLEDGVPGSDQRRLLPHRAGTEAGSWAVRGAPVVGNAEESDVQAFRRRSGRKEHEGSDLTETRRDERITRLPLTHPGPLEGRVQALDRGRE